MYRLRLLIGAVSLALLGNSIASLRSIASSARLLDDVASPYRWCDAADVLDIDGEADKAAYAYDRAVILGSHEGTVLLRAANFQLTRPDPRSALPHFARLLQLVPDYDASIFSTYEAMHFPIPEVLRLGLPPQRRAAQTYFYFLLAHGAAATDLARAWQWLGTHRLTDERLAGFYAAGLLRAGQYAAAVSMWAEFAGPYPLQDIVFNGGFERPPRASPLDWTMASEQARLDSSERYAGHFALRIDFSGVENVNFHHVWQNMVAGPGTYRLEAFVKTAGMTTDEGLRLHLFDAEQATRLEFWTEPITGTHPWTPIVREIRVSPGTRLITLQICRRPSQKFDGKAAGTAWVDAVSLVLKA